MTTTITDPTTAGLAGMIEKFGWGVVAVGTGRCDVPGCCGGDVNDPFAYTVGLHAKRLPDLIVRGLDALTPHHVLNDVARQLIGGGVVRAGAPVVAARSSWMPTTASPADRADMRYAREFARGSGRRLASPLRLDRITAA